MLNKRYVVAHKRLWSAEKSGCKHEWRHGKVEQQQWEVCTLCTSDAFASAKTGCKKHGCAYSQEVGDMVRLALHIRRIIESVYYNALRQQRKNIDAILD